MLRQVIRKECVERPFGRADVAKPARTEKPAKLVSHCKRSSTIHCISLQGKQQEL